MGFSLPLAISALSLSGAALLLTTVGGTLFSSHSSAAVRKVAAPVDTSVLTFHNDVQRTGQILTETVLTPANVNSSLFGELYTVALDGKVDAQPLYVSRLTFSDQTPHSVIYAATEHDSVYAIDADTGSALWHVRVVGSDETSADPRNCSQVAPEIGITATPVIDLNAGAHGTIYLIAMSKDSGGNYHQRLHALDLTTGQEEFGGPSEITATFPGTGDDSNNGTVYFDPKQYKSRPGLLLLNGVVYAGWGSHCDLRPYTGWLMGFDQSTLKRVSVFNFAPNGNEAALWNAGGGLTADPATGRIFVSVANGTFDTTVNGDGFPSQGDYGNAFVKLNPTSGQMVAEDFWTMHDTVRESVNDGDLGSGGLMLLPDLKDAAGNTIQLGTGAGKDGRIYVFNRANMGKFNSQADTSLYQEIDYVIGPVFSSPAWFNGTVYYGSVGEPIQAFVTHNALLEAKPASATADVFAYPGVTPTISANGTSDGIVWAVESATTAVLHAYDATDLSVELYNSNQAAGGRDQFGAGNKYIVPTIADGRVIVGTPNGIAVFGLLHASAPSQTITFLAIPSQLVGTPLTLTASASSGLAVSYSASPSSVCAVSGSTATFAAPGTCTITASQLGSGSYNAATSVSQTFAVLSPQTITFGAIGPQTVGTPVTLNPLATSGLQVSLASYSTDVCKVIGSNVTFVNAGTCSLAASQTGSSAYAPAATVIQTFAVFYTQTIAFPEIGVQTVRRPLTLAATASSRLPVTFTATPLDVCSVSENVALFSYIGTCTITASQSGNDSYQAAPSVSRSFTVIGASSLQFVPLTPCRVADTRNADGPLGGPGLASASVRNFPVLESNCGVPATAVMYSLNITAVPLGPLGFLTIWPAGQPQPYVSTLNSWDGRTKANAAIVNAGAVGEVSVYVSNPSHVILDVNGYFIPVAVGSFLSFHPVAPCRIADTRNPDGPFGGPFMSAGETRSFTLPSSACGIPSDVGAYSLNFTVAPHGTFGYLSTWATGQPQPFVSTLNAFEGEITANAAIVPAGEGGGVSVYVTHETDVIIDVNGYFAPAASGGLSFYNLASCRALDTRSIGTQQPFAGKLAVEMAGSNCSVPATAQAILANATVVPEDTLGYLTLWGDGEQQPYVSTLNAFDGSTTSNMTIIPMSNGSVDAFASDPTHLILDISGYFAP
jgi:hypothetical protein